MDTNQVADAIQRIRDYSSQIKRAMDDQQELVRQLNNLSAATKQRLFQTYQNQSGPVKNIRRQTAEALTDGLLDIHQLTYLIEQAVEENPAAFKTIYQTWYSILYPLLLGDFGSQVWEEFNQVGDWIIGQLGKDLPLKKKVFDFSGERQNGSHRCWFAIIHESHDKQSTAKQLFLNIESGIAEYCLLDFPAQIRQDEVLVPVGQPFEVEEMLAVFKKSLPEILQDVHQSAVEPLLIDPKAQICKISMGPAEIDPDTYNMFVNAGLVLVNGSTGPLASSDETQGELFKDGLVTGDYFYLCRGNEKFELFGRFTGPSEDASDEKLAENDWKQRPFEVIKSAISSKNYKGPQKWWTPNFRSTCCRIPNSELKQANQEIFEPFFNLQITKTSPSMNLSTAAEVVEQPLNQILYGPPGTGKTYHTIDKALEILKVKTTGLTRTEIKKLFDEKATAGQIVFTTFHQNMTYEDFVEGIKPITEKGKVTYEVVPGIFRQLCDSAGTPNESAFNKAYDQLKKDLVDIEKLELKTPTQKPFWISLNSNDNFNLYTGQPDNKQGSLTRDSLQRQINNEPMYIGWDGYFKGLIAHLTDKYGYLPQSTEKNRRYVMIIDEINRGNVSQIFGELITLLEDDKRSGMTEAITVTLPYSKTKFSVPANVYILGTMNTADRSVEALDTALRRRFSFQRMPPRPDLLTPGALLSSLFNEHTDKTTISYKDAENRLLDFLQPEEKLMELLKSGPLKENDVQSLAKFDYKGIRLDLILDTINRRVSRLLDKDHQIGHSYFINLDSMAGLLKVFENKIIPLLQEFFFGDPGKIGLVLGSGFVKATEAEAADEIFAEINYDTGFLNVTYEYELKDFRNSFKEALDQLISVK